MKTQQHAAAAAATLVALARVAAAASDHVERTPFEPTTIKAPFIEQFTSDWSERWFPSAATKQQSGGEVFSYSGKWSVEEPETFPGLLGDEGLVAKSKAAQHAISAQFPQVIDPAEFAKAGKPFVVQYEAKFQEGLNCGGAYLKLLTESAEGIQAKEFSDKTPYTIMFGPDKCGGTNKVHFIIRHKSPKTGEIEEKHLVNPPYPKLAKVSNLYTLVVHANNTYDILINSESKKTGSLFEDFSPSINPPAEIDDPNDKKPKDWVEEARIPDPKAKKPEDWDEDAPYEIPDEDAKKPDGWLDNEPATVPDPDAKRPEEWDEEEDGEWIAPMVPNPRCENAAGCGTWTRPTKKNPAYKGPWIAPMIDNPAYKGEWKPRKIANPDFVEDKHPNHLTRLGGVGFEIWTMDEGILFDNLYVGDSVEQAREFARETFDKKLAIEQNRERKELEQKRKEEKEAANAAGVDDGTLLGRARAKLDVFVTAAKVDPVAAVQSYPDVAAGLAAALVGLFALVGTLSGLVGGGGGDAAASAAAKTKAKAKRAAETTKGKVAEAAKATGVADKDGEATQRKAAGKADAE